MPSRLDITGHLIEFPLNVSVGASFDVIHALPCKKSGFITLRQNEVRNITSELLDEVCVGVRKGNQSLSPSLHQYTQFLNDWSASIF